MSLAWGALIIVIFFMLIFKGDELMCEIGTHDVAAYNLCTVTEDCVITYEATQDFIVGSNWIGKYCD
jgi:hypothetical protein